jgi:hypothetical protein
LFIAAASPLKNPPDQEVINGYFIIKFRADKERQRLDEFTPDAFVFRDFMI